MTELTLRRQIKKAIDSLAADRLPSVADYITFLNRPTLGQRIEQAERDLKANKGVNWRKIKRTSTRGTMQRAHVLPREARRPSKS